MEDENDGGDMSVLSQGDEELIQCLEDILAEDESKPTDGETTETKEENEKKVQGSLTKWLSREVVGREDPKRNRPAYLTGSEREKLPLIILII